MMADESTAGGEKRVAAGGEPDSARAARGEGQAAEVREELVIAGGAASSTQAAGMDVMEAIVRRRAIRRFSTRQLREEDLQQILTAGLYAPSAGGKQGPLFAVSQNPQVNERLGRIKRANSNPHMARDGVYVSREQPSIADDPNLRDAFYGAPCVITLFAPRGFAFAVDDCAVAAENMMLAATALGVGSCYIGQGWTAFADPYGQDVLREWSIPGGYYAVLQLLLGYPREGDTHPSAKPRKAARVLRF